jgi:hypothetical protein
MECLLMKTYGWTPEYIDTEIVGCRLWAYWAWARQNEASFWGSSIEPVAGYIAQEIKKLKSK